MKQLADRNVYSSGNISQAIFSQGESQIFAFLPFLQRNVIMSF